VLRQALKKLNPLPTPESLVEAASLYKHLMDRQIVYDIFDPLFDKRRPDHMGRIPPFEAGQIIIGKLDKGDLSIPLFLKYFRRTAIPKDCSVCSEALHDIDIGTESNWKQICQKFMGPWMWDVLLFPTPSYLSSCAHEIDYCKGCLSTHLTTQLKQLGRSGCDRLSCPTCNRILVDIETRRFGTKETVATYVISLA